MKSFRRLLVLQPLVVFALLLVTPLLPILSLIQLFTSPPTNTNNNNAAAIVVVVAFGSSFSSSSTAATNGNTGSRMRNSDNHRTSFGTGTAHQQQSARNSVFNSSRRRRRTITIRRSEMFMMIHPNHSNDNNSNDNNNRNSLSSPTEKSMSLTSPIRRHLPFIPHDSRPSLSTSSSLFHSSSTESDVSTSSSTEKSLMSSLKPSVHLQLSDPTLSTTTTATSTTAVQQQQQQQSPINGATTNMRTTTDTHIINNKNMNNKNNTALHHQTEINIPAQTNTKTNNNTKVTKVIVHTYYTSTNASTFWNGIESDKTSATIIPHNKNGTTTKWMSLNLSKRKFRSYLQYRQVWKDQELLHDNSTMTATNNRNITANYNDSDSHFEDVTATVHNDTSMIDEYFGIETTYYTIVTTVPTKSSSVTQNDETTKNGNHNSNNDNVIAATVDASIVADEKQKGLDNSAGTTLPAAIMGNVTTEVRDEWRRLWKAGRLITDRTELLAVYPSDQQQQNNDASMKENDKTNDAATATGTSTKQSSPKKRGGFADLLLLYTDRLMAILHDEHGEIDRNLPLQVQHNTSMISEIPGSNNSSNHNHSTQPSLQSNMDIVQWLEVNYGKQETYDIQSSTFQLYNNDTIKLQKLKHFLEWFRIQFPYYYDRCDTCGASIKEDLASAAATAATDISPTDTSSTPATTSENTTSLATTTSTSSTTKGDNTNGFTASNTCINDAHTIQAASSDDANTTDNEELTTTNESKNDEATRNQINDTNDYYENDDDEHKTFVGYVYPNQTELIGKASRTELYQCHVCSSFTRFPRYNSAQYIISNHRGRCGEYSMLLYRFLRALHHECRWVVDWADHVWVELLLQPASSTTVPLTNEVSASSTTFTATSRWIHLDPCEAAVDENFIYQGWGKKQNYIVGFYLPSILNMNESIRELKHHFMLTNTTATTNSSSSNNDDVATTCATLSNNISFIEDVTPSYTDEKWQDICQRRDESEQHIRSSIIKATNELQYKLLEYYNYTTTTIT